MAAKATITSTGSADFTDNVARLLKLRVLVGIPSESEPRKPEPGEKGTPPSNAVIGYVQEFGDDEKHIPPRPFLVPGVRSIQGQVVDQLRKAGEDAFDKDFSKVEARFEAVGMIASSAVQQKITDGPFTPLSPRTIEERAKRGRKGAKQYLQLHAEGTPREVLDNLGNNALVKPLIDTGQLRRSVTYIIKNKSG